MTLGGKMAFYKSVLTVEILSDRQISGRLDDLLYAGYLLSEGRCSGRLIRSELNTPLADSEVAALLITTGRHDPVLRRPPRPRLADRIGWFLSAR
jgi:hypothetical protein